MGSLLVIGVYHVSFFPEDKEITTFEFGDTYSADFGGERIKIFFFRKTKKYGNEGFVGYTSIKPEKLFKMKKGMQNHDMKVLGYSKMILTERIKTIKPPEREENL